MAHTVKILDIFSLTHDVKRFTVEKPSGYTFEPGQATEVAINNDKLKDQKRPFTFTSLPSDDTLEFVIKLYHDHDGVTHKIDSLREGDEFIIDDAWGAINYKGEGTFIAGGAGITPFISIFRMLEKENKLEGNKLLFANKTAKDVILESWFDELLGENFISVLQHDDIDGHEHGMINMKFLKEHLNDYSECFYVCGPDAMVKDISGYLKQLGANPDGITFEK